MQNISVAQVLALVSAGQQILAVGSATVEQFRTFIKFLHSGLSDAELDAIDDAIAAGAARHKRLAQLDIAAAATATGGTKP